MVLPSTPFEVSLISTPWPSSILGIMTYTDYIYFHGMGFNCESQLEETLRESLPGNPEHQIRYTDLELWPTLLHII